MTPRVRLIVPTLYTLSALVLPGCSGPGSRIQGSSVGSAVGGATGAVVGYRYGQAGLGQSVGSNLGSVAGSVADVARDQRSAKASSSTAMAQGATQFCPVGGEYYPSTFRFCPLHGAQLHERAETPATQP